MKKVLLAILAISYIITSVGATVHMHYCMGKFTDWGFGHNKSETCGKCGMENSGKKDKGCCKDENRFIKNNTDQKAIETDFQITQVVAVGMPVTIFEMGFAYTPTLSEENPGSHAPPQNNGLAVYIRNCVFRI